MAFEVIKSFEELTDWVIENKFTKVDRICKSEFDYHLSFIVQTKIVNCCNYSLRPCGIGDYKIDKQRNIVMGFQGSLWHFY